MRETHRKILRTLNDASFAAYFVGGSVRDHILGRTSKDVDVTTSATPEQVARLFPGSELVGAHFGVVLVKTEDDETVEVATFRTDGVYTDARRPSTVTYTNDVRVDVARRDFTMNALLMDVHGKVYDHVGGRDDLRDSLIRTVGDPVQRFQEDALRMLRAIRFASQLGFLIEHDTFEAIKTCTVRIRRISAERIRDELNRIMTSGGADFGLDLLSMSGLLEIVMPEIEALKECPQNPKYHPEGDVFIHTRRLLAQLPKGCSLTLALSALLHDVGKPAALGFKLDAHGVSVPTAYDHENIGVPIAVGILSRLKYPNDVQELVTSHVKQHMMFPSVEGMRRAKQMRFIGQPHFSELLELHRLDSMAGCGDLEAYTFVKTLSEDTPKEVVHPAKLITGRDLIERGLQPGPLFREILEAVDEAQLEGTVTTKEEAMAKVLEFVFAKASKHQEVAA